MDYGNSQSKFKPTYNLFYYQIYSIFPNKKSVHLDLHPIGSQYTVKVPVDPKIFRKTGAVGMTYRILKLQVSFYPHILPTTSTSVTYRFTVHPSSLFPFSYKRSTMENSSEVPPGGSVKMT